MPGNCYQAVTEAAAVRAPHNLLLHVCCGPCALMPISRLKDEGFMVTAWFMNPNIHPLTEYLRRREAAQECAQRHGIDILFADDAWDVTAWLRSAVGRNMPPARCTWCCESRLTATWARARELGFAWFSSSLLYSRYQPHDAIVAHGRALTKQGNDTSPAFVYRDFRTDWQVGIDTSKAWGLYRQAWCGCIYSEAERYHKRLQRCRQHSA